MHRYFLGKITCVPSDRLIIDEDGEWFYECMTQEELNTIQVNTDKDSIKSNLFYVLGRMDSVLSAVIGHITKSRYVEIVFAIKDGGKSISLNISNDKLSNNEAMTLGLIEIGLGIGIIILTPSSIAGVVVGLMVSSLMSYFLADLYLYLKDKALYLWEQIKLGFDETSKTIANFIENNTISLQKFSSNLIDKISSWMDEFEVSLISSNTHPYANPQRNLESSDYKSLIELLLDSNSKATDIDSLLHSFPNYLKNTNKDSKDSPKSLETRQESNSKDPETSKQESNPKSSNHKSSNKDSKTHATTTKSPSTIPLSLLIKDYNTSSPLANKQIQLTNIDSKQTLNNTTNANGEVIFNIDSKQRGDFFRVELINDSAYMPQAFNLAKESPYKANNANSTNYASANSLKKTNTTEKTNNTDSFGQTLVNSTANMPRKTNNTANSADHANYTFANSTNNASFTNYPEKTNNTASFTKTTNNTANTQSTKYITQKLLTPNNYQNHPAILYFKPKVKLYFNGTTLALLQGEKILSSFEARSGKMINYNLTNKAA